MRKNLFFLLVILSVIFSACKQYKDSLEDYLSYWSSQAAVYEHILPANIKDGEGYPSVSSSGDVSVILKVRNPKNYRFILNGASLSPIVFENGVQSADYTLTQQGNNHLILTYKKDFLQANEHGERNLNPVITLYDADSGRKFQETYTFKLRSNTAPPGLKEGDVSVYQTKSSGDKYYVLGLNLSFMNAVSGGGSSAPVHGDIKSIYINGTEYNLSLNSGMIGFNKPDSADFLTENEIEEVVKSPSCPEPDKLPPNGAAWRLYYKTNVKAHNGSGMGGAMKRYKVRFSDEKGLTSPEYIAHTKKNALPPVKLYTDDGYTAAISQDESNPTKIASSSGGITVYAKTEANIVNIKEIRATIYKKAAGSSEYEIHYRSKTEKETSANINFTAEQGSYYKISVEASGEGFEDSNLTEYYIQCTGGQ
ncbi:hypothetical protein [Treponema pedis]|uniref:hypothetical protein n=1 Tax=Treponema pedis TaxID=409322 RepID=UPI00197E002D|nr:hypothetical protein [Treponema pedis]QSI05373.1 hypothetical protein DYQ05_10840 [Treponema pedis]